MTYEREEKIYTVWSDWDSGANLQAKSNPQTYCECFVSECIMLLRETTGIRKYHSVCYEIAYVDNMRQKKHPHGSRTQSFLAEYCQKHQTDSVRFSLLNTVQSECFFCNVSYSSSSDGTDHLGRPSFSMAARTCCWFTTVYLSTIFDRYWSLWNWYAYPFCLLLTSTMRTKCSFAAKKNIKILNFMFSCIYLS